MLRQQSYGFLAEARRSACTRAALGAGMRAEREGGKLESICILRENLFEQPPPPQDTSGLGSVFASIPQSNGLKQMSTQVILNSLKLEIVKDSKFLV